MRVWELPERWRDEGCARYLPADAIRLKRETDEIMYVLRRDLYATRRELFLLGS